MYCGFRHQFGSDKSPNITYDWAYASHHLAATDPSFSRLTKMTYPTPTGGVILIGGFGPSRREVNFVYGSATASDPYDTGWLDHRLSRITQITTGLTDSLSPRYFWF